MENMDRLLTIRQKEKEYHDQCYKNLKLFEPGSWLQKPVKTIMDLLDILENKSEINVLDLGCGVGRNSIPIAQRIKEKEGKVVCVDILESAISNLHKYAEQYGVTSKIDSVLSDIANYSISNEFFDFIFSVSSIEHLDSKMTFNQVIDSMIAGTKHGGINCILISTGVKETVIETGEALDPMYELLFETENLIDKFKSKYKNWTLLKHTKKPYEVEITRDGRRILLESDVVTWAVQNYCK